MALLDFLFGSKDKTKKLPTMAPDQQQLLSQLVQMLGGGGQLGGLYQQGLAGLGEQMDISPEAFERFSEPYMRQFEEETIPGLAERFAGRGALASSGFGQALGAAGGGLQSQLAQLKSQLQQSALGDIMQQYQTGAGRALGAQPFGYQQQAGSAGLIPTAVTKWAGEGFKGLGQGLGYLGYPGFGG